MVYRDATVNNVVNILELAEILGCRTAGFLTTYLKLGLPLGAKYMSQGVWQGIVKNWKTGWQAGISDKTSPWLAG